MLLLVSGEGAVRTLFLANVVDAARDCAVDAELERNGSVLRWAGLETEKQKQSERHGARITSPGRKTGVQGAQVAQRAVAAPSPLSRLAILRPCTPLQCRALRTCRALSSLSPRSTPRSPSTPSTPGSTVR